jgi:hypothetical protein
MRSNGVTGTVVCTNRGLDIPLTPPGQGLRRAWEPSPTRPSWHPDDCTSPCCGRWRVVAPDTPAPPGLPAAVPAPAVTALPADDSPIPCEVCGRAVARDYVLRTGRHRHGNHPDSSPRQETRA